MVGQARALLFYDLEYAPPPNPLIDPKRAQRVIDYLRREGCVSRNQLRRPERISMEALARVHDYAYLETVTDPLVLERIFGEDVRHLDQDRILFGQRRMVAGTVMAARHVSRPWRRTRVAVNLGGGLHHAHPDRGGGFCLFNDVAVAIETLRTEGFTGSILVVDLDMHQGDGTRRIYAADGSVFTFSLHAAPWDEDPAVADLDVALGRSVGDRSYLEALDLYLPQAFDQARPELVFYLAGVDGAVDDRLGSWRLSHEALLERDRRVLRHVGGRGLVWLLAGGYGQDAWRHTARPLASVLCNFDAPIPSATERDLHHFRRIARQFSRQELSGVTHEDLEIRESDIYADLLGSGAREKLLGYYSLYGIELLFERYGVLTKLRAAGFPQVRFDLSFNDPTGERLRVLSRDSRSDLLVELVLRVDRSQEDLRLLSIEWLLLQNPRRRPSADRPLLPGQSHPGLGVLRDLVGMLVMVCERLGFDGLRFLPAHYHVAAQAHGLLRFLDPEDEARFAALEEALAGLSLARASRMLHGGGVVDEAGERVRWVPAPMVFPVSDALRARVESDEHDQAVEAASQRFQFHCAVARGGAAVESPS